MSTRKEIIKELDNILAPCRGPLPSKARALVNQLLEMKQIPTALYIDAANRGRREDEPFVQYVEDMPGRRGGLLSVLSNGEKEPFSERAQCGYNFSHLVMTGPLDGLVHEYQCPRCGVTGEYQAPLAEG